MTIVVMVVACTTKESTYPSNARKQPISIYIDRDFNDEEQKEIDRIFFAWTFASSGIVRFNIHWNTPKPSKSHDYYKPKRNQGFFIWRLSMPEQDMQYLHGLFVPGPGDNSANILIFTDAIPRYHFFQVVTHEIGHLIGLDHIEGQESAIMYPQATGECISELDMLDLCALYECKPRDTCVNLLPLDHTL